MRKVLRYILPLALILGSIGVVVILAGIAAGKRPEQRADGPQAVLVDTIPAESRSLNFIVNSQGSVRPRTQTTLVAEVSGTIVEVSSDFVAGGFFRNGEVLLQIDPSDYRTALKRAEASLASRQAKLAEERARSEQALKDWKNLGRKGEPPDLVLRKPQLADALANVQAAEADVEKARRDLQRTRITVPYDGLVREKRVDLGQYVAPGTQLGVTFAVDTAEIRLPLSPSDLAFLDLPAATETAPEELPDVTLSTELGNEIKTWSAKIIRTEGVLDESSRVLYAIAQVIDPYGVLGLSEQDELRVGTFVRAAIEGKYIEDVIVLPRHVLKSGNTVLVANADRKLEIREVEVARAEPEVVYITDGITDGELVVTTTLDAPIPGLELAISGEEATPAADEPLDAAVTSTGQGR